MAEDIAGATLRALIDAEAPLRPARAVKLALLVAEALEPLHAQGRAHGDVRAEQVVLRNGGVSLLPAPMALSLDAITQASDVRAAAALLYEMLTRTEPNDVRVSLRTPAMVPQRLDDLLERALDTSRAFATARPFAQELRVCLVDALGAGRQPRRGGF
jgi:hypothetical protein